MTKRMQMSKVMVNVLRIMDQGFELRTSPERCYLDGFGTIQLKTFDALRVRGLIKRRGGGCSFPTVVWVPV